MQKKIILRTSLIILILVGSVFTIKLIKVDSNTTTNNENEKSNPSNLDNEKKYTNKNFDSSDDKNYDFDETEKKDSQYNYFDEKKESIRIKDLKSLDDITDEMISQRSVGYNTEGYTSNYTDNNFIISFNTFSGCDFSKIIQVEKETEVTLRYTTTINEDSLKIALLIDDEVITIPIEDKEFTYILPQGKINLVITGYKASGEIEMSLDSINGVKIIQNTEFF